MEEKDSKVSENVRWIGYVGRENMISNAVAEIFKLIQYEDVRIYNEVISKIVDGDFEQSNISVQKKINNSISDIMIVQNSYCIVIEAKIEDKINTDQFKKYLESLKGISNVKLIYLLRDYSKEDLNKKKELAQKANITLNFVTYQEIIDEFRKYSFSKVLQQLIDELEEYLDENGLLETWKKRIDIVNCKQSLQDIGNGNNEGYYKCPLSGGNYSHKKSKFFMAYSDKKLEFIAEIKAVFYYDENDEICFMYDMREKKSDVPKIDEKSIDKNLKYFWLEGIKKITGCEKSSSGGMFGSKMYIEMEEEKKLKEITEAAENIKWNSRDDLEKKLNKKLNK